jgi:RNA polymerase sigma factor (sigma-70 family)
MDETEHELVDLVLGGDREALERFVDRYSAIVRAYLIRKMRVSALDADDLTQLLFEKLWQENWLVLRRWHGESLVAYLITIARNLALDLFRRRGRDPLFVEDPPEDPGPSTMGPDEERFQNELHAAISDCLARGQDRDRILVESFHFLGLSYREIADQMQMTINAVGVALKRAEERLRRCLDVRYPGISSLAANL